MAEETIFSDKAVSVTTSRVIIRGTTYALRNITGVKMDYTGPTVRDAIIMLLCGAGAFSIFILSGFKVFTILFGALILVGIGFLWLKKNKGMYHILILGSSGEVRALSSKDQGYIQKIVGAINDAIVKYE